MASLAGLNQMTGTEVPVDDTYMSTDDREMAAWQQSLAHSNASANNGTGDIIYDDDLESMRSEL